MTNNIRSSIGTLEASFGGVPFRVRAERQSVGGRRVIIHEYVNSRTVFIEDIGEIPERFSIDAFVHGNTYNEQGEITSDSWINKRDALKRILNIEGANTLVLPTLGIFEANALPYSVDQSQTDIGIVNFTLEFAIGVQKQGPESLPADEIEVNQNGDTVRGFLESVFSNTWQIPSGLNNILTATYDITTAATQINSFTRNFLSASAYGQLLTQTSNLIVSLPNLISLPTDLAAKLGAGTDRVLGLFSRISTSFSLGSGYEPMRDFTSYGSGLHNNSYDIRNETNTAEPTDIGNYDIPLWNQTTDERRIRNENRQLTLDFTRLNSLVIAYEQAASRDYQTEEEVQIVREELENIYQIFLRQEISDRNVIQNDSQVRNSIDNLHSSALEVLEEKEQQTFGLSVIEYLSPSNFFLIAYNLYAEQFSNSDLLFDQALVLRNLNPTLNPISAGGNITVLKTRANG